MLKFFRSIRKKLIEQDNIRKYLLYAIGEILLVVIGILIALQVNNWNENRNKEQLKDTILVKISNELLTDLSSIEMVREDLLLKDSNGVYLASFFNSGRSVKDFDEEKLNRAFMETNDVQEFTPLRLGYDELISSGLLNRITNDSLKVLLFEHYETSVRENLLLSQRDQYSRALADERFIYAPSGALREKNKTRLEIGNYSDNPYEEFNLDWDLIIEEGTYPMYLDRLLGVYIGQRWLLNKSEAEIRAILKLIDKEIRTQ